jgi:hypothetical protein
MTYHTFLKVVLVLAAVTNYHRYGGLTSKNVFLTVLEAGSLRSDCQYGQILVRTLFQVSDYHLLLLSLRSRRKERPVKLFF